MPDVQADNSIAHNVRAHDAAAALYERHHGEIFNPIEQNRLRAELSAALAEITTGTSEPRALDFGCGSGNLTAHLLRAGCRVTSADVSAKFLEIVEQRFRTSGRSDVLQLTGGENDLPQKTFDFVGAYSVLHHVPDYVATVRALVRALRPGGVLYIDHEASPSAWHHDIERDAWHRNGKRRVIWLRERFSEALSPAWFMYRVRRLRDPRASLEGDLHVWPDDHIEWERIEFGVGQEGGVPVRVTDYLVYRRSYDELVYEHYRNRCADTRCFVVRRGDTVAS